MIAPAVFWPCALGSTFFVAGIYMYRRDLLDRSPRPGAGILALSWVFIAAALAAFAGEHYTLAKGLLPMVPKWLPARLGIVYFVGVAHLAAALSFVARRCLRWSTFLLGVMFALFVLLLHGPGAITHPAIRIAWIVAVRETTYSLGALALFSIVVRDEWPGVSHGVAAAARIWSGMVITYYGVDHFLHPQFSPGVPDTKITASWVPLPHVLAYVTGMLLIAFGTAMVLKKNAGSAGKYAGLLMLALTVVLYVPEFFLARGVAQQVEGINFVADTLLFSGTMLAIANAIYASESKPRAQTQFSQVISAANM